ncbi:cytochrome b/b6 domain-containing protein [Prosthecomicrobium sp. N25]|uniref:cytochrome b/b6 domain-containing protein n=1 Tax=Prosthecomicrobium sp. N25 TaxID=3129254 RepID=UPI003076F74E
MTDIADVSLPVQETVKVWDPFVRVFHWSVVAGFAAAFATGDELTRLHIAVGYAVAALVALRVVWGFVGPLHARFSDFVRGPRTVLAYITAALAFRAPRFLGHNPAGGAMVVVLLVMLSAVSLSGWALTLDAFWGDEAMEELHELLVYMALGMVVLHVAGVLFASVEHGENLIRAMVTGMKRAR